VHARARVAAGARPVDDQIRRRAHVLPFLSRPSPTRAPERPGGTAKGDAHGTEASTRERARERLHHLSITAEFRMGVHEDEPVSRRRRGRERRVVGDDALYARPVARSREVRALAKHDEGESDAARGTAANEEIDKYNTREDARDRACE
tara:strand:- start:1151 stop:1597 length:447 start_codon:yes stop_codon:yes gene_type:complete